MEMIMSGFQRMLPIRDNVLTIGEIAANWNSLYSHDHDKDMVMGIEVEILLSLFWQGLMPTNMPRLDFLMLLANPMLNFHPNILFYDGDEKPLNTKKKCIKVPNDRSKWTDEDPEIIEAYDILVDCKPSDYEVNHILTTILHLEIQFLDFEKEMDKHTTQFHYLDFWNPFPHKQSSFNQRTA